MWSTSHPMARCYAAPFDQNRLRITGSAIPLIENVSVALYSQLARRSRSRIPVRSSIRVERQPQSELVWVSMEGNGDTPRTPRRVVGDNSSAFRSRPMPRDVAVTLTTGTRQDVWTRSLETGAMHRLTLDQRWIAQLPAEMDARRTCVDVSSPTDPASAGELWRQPRQWQCAVPSASSQTGPSSTRVSSHGTAGGSVYRAGGSELRATRH